MSQRPHLVSVDLGEIVHDQLDAIVKRTKRSQSDVIRDLIALEYHYQMLSKIKRTLTNTLKETPKETRKTTEEEQHLIDVYREVYNVKKRVYYPPALACIRAAVSNGLSYDQIEEIIRVSPNDSWLASLLAKGQTPQLHLILSEKSIANLWDLAQEAMVSDAHRAQLRLEGSIKPDALRLLKTLLDSDQYSQAWDMIDAAKTEEQVNSIVEAASQNAWAESVSKLRTAIFFDIPEEV